MFTVVKISNSAIVPELINNECRKELLQLILNRLIYCKGKSFCNRFLTRKIILVLKKFNP